MEEKDKKNVHRKEKNNDGIQKVDIDNKEG